MSITVGVEIKEDSYPALKVFIEDDEYELDLDDARALRDTLDALIKVVEEHGQDEDG